MTLKFLILFISYSLSNLYSYFTVFVSEKLNWNYTGLANAFYDHFAAKLPVWICVFHFLNYYILLFWLNKYFFYFFLPFVFLYYINVHSNVPDENILLLYILLLWYYYIMVHDKLFIIFMIIVVFHRFLGYNAISLTPL